MRRAQPGWSPRGLPVAEQDLFWQRLSRAGRLLARTSPVGVALRRSDTGEMLVAKAGATAKTSATLTPGMAGETTTQLNVGIKHAF